MPYFNCFHHRPMQPPGFHIRGFAGLGALLLALAWFSGCSTRELTVPDGWMSIPISETASAGSTAEVPQRQTPHLQVLIAHGASYAVHVALRLETGAGQGVGGGAGGVLFWDPGGGYGIHAPIRTRSSDLIIDDPPTVSQYWLWSQKRRSIGLEVFEWSVTRAEAEMMGRILREGTTASNPQGEFRPDAVALACSRSVSDFLHRFAPPRMRVPETYFFPDDLSDALWAQSANHVYLYRLDQLALRCQRR